MRSPQSVWRRLWIFVKPYRWKLVLTFFIALLATPLSLLAPWPLRIAVDSVLGNHPMPGVLTAPIIWFGLSSVAARLIFVCALLVAITLLMYLQGLLSWRVQTWLGEKMVLNLRASLFSHAQRLSLAYHDRTGTSDSVYRIQYDAQSLQFVVISGLIPLALSAITLCGMIVVTAMIDKQIAIVTLVLCPALYWITRHFSRRLRERWFEVKDLDSSAMSVVQEALSAVRVVKAFGREEHEQERFVTRCNQRLAGEIDLARIQGNFDLAVGVTVAVGSAVALAIGVFHAKAGSLTIGQLFVVMAYLSQLYEPLKTISKKTADLQSGLASTERALALLDKLPEVHESSHARALLRARGHFRFNHLSFAYEPDRPVLQNLNLDVPSGSRVGIRGQTGVGKTTLINLLTRFYDPTSGAVLLDGCDLREYRLRDLRNQFAIVMQDPILFSTSIAENIAYGRPGATRDEIVRAAQDANAHDFILRLPQGYHTEVGERGMCLSGGERQRISIARAFLKNAPILLLDEPTSSVDYATEASIMESMEHLMRGRTVFMIAHRLSTLRTCDLQLELSGSRIRVLSPGNWKTV
jgi:ATP-binding cassette subfamily B protein